MWPRALFRGFLPVQEEARHSFGPLFTDGELKTSGTLKFEPTRALKKSLTSEKMSVSSDIEVMLSLSA